MLDVLIGVADEVTNREVDKVINMMAEFASNTSYVPGGQISN